VPITDLLAVEAAAIGCGRSSAYQIVAPAPPRKGGWRKKSTSSGQ
jgi:hypothetical protein